MTMNDPNAILFSGRGFTTADLALMRQAANDYAGLGITEIARTVCEWLDWKRPNGKLKNHECRLLLEQLQAQGFLTLPALRPTGGRGPRPVAINAQSDAPKPLHTTIAALAPLRLSLVNPTEASLWRQLIQRYHYLGYRTPVGAHLRYFVKSADGHLLACLLWTSAAWSMAPRDHWIGWTPRQRARNLPFIVNHARFLILPWIRVKSLASTILARAAKQLPHDWRQHYGCSPLLLETVVDATRFKGTCYRAANWRLLGQTTGRGRMDRHHHASLPVKLIFVFPLHRRAQHLLQVSDPPQTAAIDV